MKRLDIITNVGYIQESLEHSEWKGLNKEQTALEIKKIIDEVVKLVSKNESLHDVMLSDDTDDELEDFEPSKCWLFDKCKNKHKGEHCDDLMPNSMYCFEE